MRLVATLVGSLLIAFLADPTAAAVFLVDDTADAVDANPGDGLCQSPSGQCTLRAAVMETNSLSGADTIQLPVGVYQLAILGSDEDQSATGDLDVLGDLSIRSLGTRLDTVILPDATDRIFHSFPGTTLELHSIGLRGGIGTTPPDGVLILAEGDLAVTNLEIAEVFAERARGGAILSRADLVIEDSSLRNIWTTQGSTGAGVAILHEGQNLKIERSEFNSNGGRGSIIETVSSDATIISSHFEGNNTDNPFRALIDGGRSVFIADTRFIGNVGAIRSPNIMTIQGGEIAGGCNPVLSGGFLVADRLKITGQTGGCDISAAPLSAGGDVTITRSVFRNNGGTLGIVRVSGTVRIHGSEFSGNDSIGGGGAIKGDVTEIVNSTISGNSVFFPNAGGTIEGDVGLLINSTITDNEVVGGTGGGISGTIGYMKGSILAGNRAATGPDCSGSIVSGGFNIIGNADGCNVSTLPSDLVGNGFSPIDPALAPLADDSGSSQTHRPLLGSPAVDAMPAADCTWDDDGDPQTPEVPLTEDQRGASRPLGPWPAKCEIGAHEVTQCEDGLDNDNDGNIDWDGSPPDAHCTGPLDDRERRASTCGLGPELALLLPLLVVWRTRRTRWR